MAEDMARRGARLVLVAREAERLEHAAAAIEAACTTCVQRVALDATSPEAPQRIASLLTRAGSGRRYVVIAIGAWYAGPIVGCPQALLDRLTVANATAPLAICRQALPHLRPGDGILVVGSLAGCVPLPWMSLYAATKAQLHAGALGLRAELAGTGIGMSVLAPGPVLTGFVPRRTGSSWRWLVDLACSSPETVARAGCKGLLSDTAFIVPGLLARIGWLGLRLLPAVALDRLARLLLAPLAPAAGRRGARTPPRGVEASSHPAE